MLLDVTEPHMGTQNSDQPFIWYSGIKKLTRYHSHIGWSRLPGLSLNDPQTVLLETLA